MKVHTCNPSTPGRDKVILGYTASLGQERKKGGKKGKEGNERKERGGEGRKGRKKTE